MICVIHNVSYFQLLCSLKVAMSTNNKDGLAVENRHKNRNLDIIPGKFHHLPVTPQVKNVKKIIL